MISSPVIWALIDERIGTGNQAKSVAISLGLPFVEKHLSWSRIARLPNIILGRSLSALRRDVRHTICPPWPDLVIASGRRAASVSRFIKKNSMNHSKLVHIMYPGRMFAEDFDLLAIPKHDENIPDLVNILRIFGAPNLINQNWLPDQEFSWDQKFANLREPLVGLIMGGATKSRHFSKRLAANLGYQVAEMVKKVNGSLVITTSPRTGTVIEDVIAALHEKGIRASYIFRWKSSTSVDANPYFGILSRSRYLIVTGDSTSMCSEACALGKPVFIFAPEDFLHEKHIRFVDQLISGGYAVNLGEWNINLENSSPLKKLDAAYQIAEEIRNRKIINV